VVAQQAGYTSWLPALLPGVGFLDITSPSGITVALNGAVLASPSPSPAPPPPPAAEVSNTLALIIGLSVGGGVLLCILAAAVAVAQLRLVQAAAQAGAQEPPKAPQQLRLQAPPPQLRLQAPPPQLRLQAPPQQLQLQAPPQPSPQARPAPAAVRAPSPLRISDAPSPLRLPPMLNILLRRKGALTASGALARQVSITESEYDAMGVDGFNLLLAAGALVEGQEVVGEGAQEPQADGRLALHIYDE
jgi:hypothetical protein